MSYREKREQLKKQIDELNGLVEQLRKVGPKHRTYTKYRLALLTSGMRNVIRGIGGALFAIATRHCVSFGMGSLDTPLYMLGMTALFILVGIFMGGWTAEDAGWVSCNREGRQLIEEELIEAKKILQEFEDEKLQLEPLRRKFERLESIVLQMDGKFKIKQRLHRHRVKVKFVRGGFWHVYRMTEGRYEDLVMDLDKKRERDEDRKETVKRFEAELK